MEVLHFIDSGYNAAHYNMALDEFLLQEKKGLFLCVYGWSIPTLSLGYGQRASKELDIGRILEDGFHIVRRLTGGRVVLHDAEMTYSFSGELGGRFGENLNSTFLTIATALQKSLQGLGVEGEVSKGKARDVREKESASLPCFASTSRNEIKVNGKKLLGSAQRREKDRFLQHGSLLIENRLDITDYLLLNDLEKEGYRQTLKRESTTVLEVTGQRMDYAVFSEAFKKGFSESLGLPVQEYNVCDQDCPRIRELEKKYFSDEWNGVG